MPVLPRQECGSMLLFAMGSAGFLSLPLNLNTVFAFPFNLCFMILLGFSSSKVMELPVGLLDHILLPPIFGLS